MGPGDQVSRVRGSHPDSLVTLLPLLILHLGASSEDLIGTKWKPVTWPNVPTLQMGKLRP